MILQELVIFTLDWDIGELLSRRIKVKLGKFKITDDYIYGNHPDGILRKKLSEFSTTDVLESEFNYDNIIYPNPATDYITLNLSSINPTLKRGVERIGAGVEGEVMVEIYDVMGVKIHSSSVETINELSLQRMDVSNLSPGVYFLKVNNKFYKFVRAL